MVVVICQWDRGMFNKFNGHKCRLILIVIDSH
ncbi:hypothetical protein MOVI109754_11900 [Moritella viscosa]